MLDGSSGRDDGASIDGTTTILARQPIFDGEQRVRAFELLFRDGVHNFCTSNNGDQATMSVLANLLQGAGSDVLTGGMPAFVNLCRRSLLSGIAETLPPTLVVLELPVGLTLDQPVIEACRRAREKGFRILLDDITMLDESHPLLDLCQMVKVAVPMTSPRTRAKILAIARARGIATIAEKLETMGAFESALAEGFDLFQGYFLCRPNVMAAPVVPTDWRAIAAMLELVRDPDVSVKQVARCIEADIGLTYSLLRFANAPIFGLAREIKSVEQAVMRLGKSAVCRWLYVCAVQRMSEGRPSSLPVQALERAAYCRELAVRLELKPDFQESAFLVGLLSLVDAILGRPLTAVLEQLPLDTTISSALLLEAGDEKASENVRMLADLLAVARSHERGAWPELAELAGRLGISDDVRGSAYMTALGQLEFEHAEIARASRAQPGPAAIDELLKLAEAGQAFAVAKAC